MNTLIIFLGASASGKTALVKTLINKYNFYRHLTYTTRQPRIDEKNGVDYYFVSKEEFTQLRKADYFVETTKYQKHFYGSPVPNVTLPLVSILETCGAKKFKKRFPRECTVVFLLCSKSECITRMKKRGDNPLEIRKRVIKDGHLFNRRNEKWVDIVIDSTNLSTNECVETFLKLYNEKELIRNAE